MNLLKERLISFVNKLPYVRGLVKRLAYYNSVLFFPPEHYYSPVICKEEVKENEEWIWKGVVIPSVDGVSLHLKEQEDLLENFKKYVSEFDFPEQSTNPIVFRLDNPFFSYHDAFILSSFIRHFSPRQIIEIGSGFSSALMMEVNERFFKDSINLHFIEPFPEERLDAFVKNRTSVKTYKEKIQQIDLSLLKQLKSNDILFVDSSHVSKTGSDLNFILFNILPILEPGVILHFHDVFYPFEYPKEWVYLGRSWNEAYILRAFLTNNENCQILYFNDAMTSLFPDKTKEISILSKSRGSSLWIQKIK